jgi:hypothetical protein
MNRHYDRYLVRKYAPLYRDRYSDMQYTAMCWGFSVGDGWFTIINNLSFLLLRDYLDAKKEFEDINNRIGELKFKFDGATPSKHNVIITQDTIDQARTKMLEVEKNVPVVTQVKEKYGTLRFYVNGATDSQYKLIDFAEYMSETTCEICGNKGKLVGQGWFSVRCTQHRNDND